LICKTLSILAFHLNSDFLEPAKLLLCNIQIVIFEKPIAANDSSIIREKMTRKIHWNCPQAKLQQADQAIQSKKYSGCLIARVLSRCEKRAPFVANFPLTTKLQSRYL
jgi:hypothetical protein